MNTKQAHLSRRRAHRARRVLKGGGVRSTKRIYRARIKQRGVLRTFLGTVRAEANRYVTRGRKVDTVTAPPKRSWFRRLFGRRV